MNKISLTKVERKSIICSSLFYVLLIYIITDQMINGMYVIKLFPLLYFLGLFEKKFFNKMYMTITIVGFTTFVMSIIKLWDFNLNVVIITLTHICILIFGIITGYIFNEFKLNKRKVIELKVYKKIIYIISIILSFIFAILLNILLNGNIVDFINSKKSLDTFVKDKYLNTSYKIENIKFNVFENKRNYTYFVNISEKIYIFEEKTNGIFEDINYTNRLEDINKEVNEKFKNDIEEYQVKLDLIDSSKSNIFLEYEDSLLNPSKASVNILIKKSTLTEDDMNNLKNTLIYIKNKEYLKEYKLEFFIYFNENVVKIKSDKVSSLNLEFLNKSLEVELL